MSEVFRCDDKETLVAYLYGEVDGEVRREVERHLRTCAACTRESEGLQSVRQTLQSWIPPEPVLDVEIVARPTPIRPATVLAPSRWASLRTLPAWAQVAAAALFIGVGLAIANVNVQSTTDGVVVTTGWTRPAAARVAPMAVRETRSADWRPELAAIEQTLRKEISAQSASMRPAMTATPVSGSPDAAALLRRVQAMIEESELRQRQEFAAKLIQTQRIWDVQRQTDLVQFQRSLTSVQNRTLAVQVNQQQINSQVQHLQRASFAPPNQ